MPTPSEIRAQLEAKVEAEKRDETIKAQEFMQKTGLASNQRARDVPGFSAKPSSVKASWEKRVEYESKADIAKAKDFTDRVDWSKKRSTDVPGVSAKPSQVKTAIEAKVKEESKSDSVKARNYLESGATVRTGSGQQTTRDARDHVPKIMAKPSQIKGGIEKRVVKEQAPADDKARQFLEETTYLGVLPRKKKSNLIPLSVLFSKPHKDQLKISPNGKYLAWRSRGRSMVDPQEEDNGTMNIFVKTRDTSVVRQITFYKDLDVCVHYEFTPDDKSIVFLREVKRGSELYHLYTIDIEPFFEQNGDAQYPPPTQPRDLMSNKKNMTCGIGFVGGIQMWTSPESPRQVYVSTSNVGPMAMFWDISKVDVDNGKITLVEQNPMSSKPSMMHIIFWTFIARIVSFCCCCIKVKPPGVPIQWFVDNDMNFRGKIEVDLLNLGISFLARAKDKNKWNTLHSCTFEEANLQLLGSSGGSGTARMGFHGSHVDVHMCAFKSEGRVSDTTTYERFNTDTGGHVKRLCGGDIKSDITGFACDPKGAAQFVEYEQDKPVLVPVRADSIVKEDLAYIKSWFKPFVTFRIVSRTAEDDYWIISAQNDIGMAMFKGSTSGWFGFTRRTSTSLSPDGTTSSMITRNIELIYPARPEMNRYKLARVYPVHVKARDGVDITCYLTSTQEAPTIKGFQQEELSPPSPMVVVIHGGPQARDSWGYNPLCQFLCSRGFQVLQVNYRGSTGFGARFLRLGMNGEFYKTLQDDIEDCIEYATSPFDAEEDLAGDIPYRPWGDKKQLAVLGGSFGGYSALWQIQANPGRYKCAVAICPISSVGAADEQSKKALSGSPLVAKYWRKVFGKDVSTKKDVAIKASPMYRMDKVATGASIALYHGEDDPRAPIQHSYNILKELKSKGIAGEMVAFEGEGHGISKRANSLYMYYRIEDFLCKQFNMKAYDAEDDKEQFEKNTATVKWSAEYKQEV